MSKKLPVAAPFEVGRSVILNSLKDVTFCGAAAVRGFRDAWSARQVTCDLGAGIVAHPALSGHVVALLRREEVAAALTLDEDARGEPILDLKKAQKLARHLGRVCSPSRDIPNVPPTTQLLAQLDSESRWNLVLPITDGEDREILDRLQDERTTYLDVLFDVTGYIPAPRVPISIGVARFGVGRPDQIRAICDETQQAIDLVREQGLARPGSDVKYPLGEYALGPAQVLD